jgi:hypothetical protein
MVNVRPSVALMEVIILLHEESGRGSIRFQTKQLG